MIDILHHYREIWLTDFEYSQPDGERIGLPHCMVAREFRTGRTLRVWADELANMAEPPFPTGDDVLFVAYYAPAELGSFLGLGWQMPARILDLFTEFRCMTNGLSVPCGNSLLGAMAYFGLGAIDGAEKEDMRDLAIRGGPFTAEERLALLDYCESDVVALAKLLPAMLPRIDLPRALLRGRYMAAVAKMEWNGTPIDVPTLNELRDNWKAIQGELIRRIDADYRVFDGRTFKRDLFAQWLIRNDIPWPRLASGQLALDDDTFRQMARTHPAVAPLRELRHSLGEMRLFSNLAVGRDGRNRCMLSAFRARTGRNQPSNAKFIFGPSAWLRGLIKPARGQAVAYVDWSQQEFGIAAALSGDAAMMEAYASGDPYLTFAKQAGAVPPDATKQTHPKERDLFKVCALAVQYGMGSQSLAVSLGEPEAKARELLGLNRKVYAKFWQWSEGAVNHAMLRNWLQTVFGWRIQVGSNVNSRSLQNFPVQGNGAEMLRVACCLATERGIKVCCPVHDAVLVEGPAGEIHEVVADTQRAMAEASRAVLGGFELWADAEVVTYPDRYMDKRGRRMWDTVLELLRGVPKGDSYLSSSGTGTCPGMGHPYSLIVL